MIRTILSGNRRGYTKSITIKPVFAFLPTKLNTGKYVWLRTVWKETIGSFVVYSIIDLKHVYHEHDPGITVDNFYYLKEDDRIIFGSTTHSKRTSDLHEKYIFSDDDAST